MNFRNGIELSKQSIQTAHSTYDRPGTTSNDYSLVSQKQIKTFFRQDPKIYNAYNKGLRVKYRRASKQNLFMLLAL